MILRIITIFKGCNYASWCLNGIEISAWWNWCQDLQYTVLHKCSSSWLQLTLLAQYLWIVILLLKLNALYISLNQVQSKHYKSVFMTASENFKGKYKNSEMWLFTSPFLPFLACYTCGGEVVGQFKNIVHTFETSDTILKRTI